MRRGQEWWWSRLLTVILVTGIMVAIGGLFYEYYEYSTASKSELLPEASKAPAPSVSAALLPAEAADSELAYLHGRDLRELSIRLGAVRGDRQAVRELAYGSGSKWTQSIFDSLPEISVLCEHYHRWKAVDWVNEYYTWPGRYRIEPEEFGLSRNGIQALRYGAGISYAQALLQELKSPAWNRDGCSLISEATIVRQLAEVLDALGLAPDAIMTTPKKIAELVRRAPWARP